MRTPSNSKRFFKQIIVFLFLFLLPTQFGKHFIADFSYVNGVLIDYLMPAVYLTDILALAVVGMYLKQVVHAIKKTLWTFLFVITVLILHAFLSRHPLLSLLTVLKIVELVLIVYATQHIMRPRLVLTAFLLGAVGELTLTVSQLSAGASLQGFFYFLGERYISISHPGAATASLFEKIFLRPYGTFSHPNSMAGFYLLLYFYFLTNHGLRSSFKLYTLAAVIFTALIFISFSKAAILVYLVLNGIYALRYMKIECKLCLVARIITMAVIAVIFLSASADPFSFEKRMLILKDSISILGSHLLWGVGWGHHLIYQAGYASPYPYFFLQPVHNILVLFLMQAGAVLTGILVLVMYKQFKSHLKKPAFLFCFLTVFATGMVDHYWLTLQQNWLLIGVVYGLLQASWKKVTVQESSKGICKY